MKKTLHDLKDIEDFFMEHDTKPTNSKTASKSPKILENKVEVLEKEIRDLKKQISLLESNIDRKSSNKGANLNTRDTEDIAKMFMDFSVDTLQDKEAKKELNTLKDENERLKKENRNLSKHMKVVEIQKKEKTSKKVSYEEILISTRKKYEFLGESSKSAIASAEYIFLNESTTGFDYSGTYINYVKALEIELKRVFGKTNEKLTFGNLMEKLRKNPNFKGFVDRIEAEKVGEVRNSAVHTRPISKYECGKIRKIILEDGWLDRISFLVEESLKVKKDSYIEYDMFIIEKIGKQFVNGKNYVHYHTDGDMDLLSQNANLKDFIKGKGKVIKKDAQYFIIAE